MTKRDHSAAAKKARRVYKKMKAARMELISDLKAQYRADVASGLVDPEPPKLTDPVLQKQLQIYARLLVCPDFSGGSK